MKPEDKIIRDPLYGFIEFPSSISPILGALPLIRLTRIKQLAHTFLVYPSAVHSRFEHSIGVYHLAGLMADRLNLSKEKKEIVQLAAVLHDIGHGPYSHPFEEVMMYVTQDENFSHVDVTKLILEYDESLRNLLSDEKIRSIIEIYENRGQSLESEIITGGIDADKLDYLRRDSYHTGVAYGIFDIERILRTLTPIEGGERKFLGVLEKGMYALESYRLARYSMHTQVYEHKTRLITDDMFIRAVKLSIKEGILDPDSINPKKDPERFVREYLKLDDYSILHKILEVGDDKRSMSKDFVDRLLKRRLFKSAYSIYLNQHDVPNSLIREKLIKLNKKEVSEIEKKISNEAHISQEDVILHVQSSKIKLYEKLGEDEFLNDEKLLIKREKEVVAFDEITPFSLKQKTIRRLFVFCPEEYRGKVNEIAKSILGIE
ncbi:MAG: HD domain-containing protein [Nitrososphaeria archaeon]